MTDWPDDADGDVLRRIAEVGFDFNKVASVDFNVDFDTWPPSDSALAEVSRAFSDALVTMEEGYVLIRLDRLLTYPFFPEMQARLSERTAKFCGHCDMWECWFSAGRTNAH